MVFGFACLMILRSSGSCRRPYLPWASLSLKLANSLPASSQSQTHVPVIPDSHATTLCQYFPCSKSPQGQVHAKTKDSTLLPRASRNYSNWLVPTCLPRLPYLSLAVTVKAYACAMLSLFLPLWPVCLATLPPAPLGTISNKHFFQWR